MISRASTPVDSPPDLTLVLSEVPGPSERRTKGQEAKGSSLLTGKSHKIVMQEAFSFPEPGCVIGKCTWCVHIGVCECACALYAQHSIVLLEPALGW